MTSTLLVSTRKGLFTCERDGAGWRVARSAFLGDRVTLTLCDPRDGSWYAALDHGHFGVKLHRSRDGGATWTEIATPAYPAKPEGVEEVNPFGRPVPWATKLIWAMAIAPDAPGALWCGTMPGGLFRSDDAGASWRLVEALWHHPARLMWFGGGADDAGIHSICVDPRDPRRIAIAVSCGGVWRSDDAGASWAAHTRGMSAAYMPPDRADDPDIQDPHAMVQCPAAPDVFWVQHHNGIFRSTDDLASWQPIASAGPSTFGFPVAVHPRDPEVAWFVPAESDQRRVPVDGAMAVTRTRDGGHSFEVLRDGLPQHHAYDLIYRHGLDVSADGETLAMGSTTGSVWIGDDQGQRWTAISHHLPPVHAVRFAP
jgi:photosystem II stability/assembly factor-like uncharacterized protein